MTQPLQPPTELRHAVADLLAEYVHRIDENRLEEWLDLFAPDCDYRVVSRENVEQGLPGMTIWCDSRNMLRDRVESLRHVNEYNLHWDRHVLGPVRFLGEEAGLWTVEASYSLYQTSQETGESRLFSVGLYRCQVAAGEGGARFKAVQVIADTGLIPTLLATPV
jgi:anthranilate 1,2-dioxygenase small subunit